MIFKTYKVRSVKLSIEIEDAKGKKVLKRKVKYVDIANCSISSLPSIASDRLSVDISFSGRAERKTK